jgi:peptidoglycan/LPS O-acetylase OafA/YrhL
MTQSPPRQTFRHDINGLRAIAVVSVVAFHVERRLAPGGFVGVDIFFVISGYLISRIILSEIWADHFSLRRFYARRVRRIFPALAVVLGVVWICGLLWLSPPALTVLGQHQLEAAAYILNFSLASDANYFAPSAQGNPLLHLWSLSIEEQFYIVWPALLLFASRLRLPTGALILLFLALSFGFNLYQTPRDPTAAFYLPWGRVWELALGAAVARFEFFRSKLPVPRQGALALVGIALMVGAIFLFDESQPFPCWRAAVPTLGCALVIAFPGRWSERILRAPPMQFFGSLSYPFYLWHWPLLAFAFLRWGDLAPLGLRPALAVLALILAALTNRFVERPVFAFSVRRPRKIVAGLASVLVALGLIGMLTRAEKGFPGRYTAQVAAIFDFPPHGFDQNVYRAGQCYDDRQDESLTAATVAQAFAPQCLQKADPAKPTILLLGDSHGAHLYPGLHAAFGDRANILQLNASYCAPLVEKIDLEAGGVAATQRCRVINDYVFAQVEALKPDIVVVGAYFGLFLNSSTWAYRDFLANFSAGASALRARGVGQVIISGQIPTWTPSLPQLAANELLSEGMSPVFSTSGLDRQNLAVDASLRQQDFGAGASYVSLVERLCEDKGCRRRLGDDLPDDLMSVDYGHFSQRGSEYVVREILGPAIEEALAARKR